MIVRVAWWPIGLLLALGMAFAGATEAADPVRDPLDRPSLASAKATSSLLTAVTRAGARLVAVGDRGIVLTSDDNGKTWAQRPTPVSVLLTNVRFVDAMRGWVVGHGGVVLGTVDGGLHWKRMLDGVQLAALMFKAAQARAEAVAAGPKDAATSATKAVEAAQQLVADGPDKPLLDVYADDDIGLLVVGAYGLVLHSGDGGAHWESWQDRIPNPTGAHLYAVVRSGGVLYLVGEQGNVFRSDDRGQTFVALPPPYKGSFFGAAAVGERDLIVFGLRGNAFVYRQDTRAWEAVKLPTSATINNGLRLADGSIALVTQAGEVLRSVDGARTFAPLMVPTAWPFVGIALAGDGSVVLAGLRGIARIALHQTISSP